MNELINFTHEKHSLRMKIIEGVHWFIVKDICEGLGIKNHNSAVENFESDERGVALIDTPGGMQEMVCVNESGLYRLIMRSDKEEAKPFQRWVTHEVLPSIRKTGYYSIKPLTLGEQLVIQAQMLRDQERKAQEALNRLERHDVKIEQAQDLAQQAFRRAEGNLGYFSVLGYSVRCKQNIDLKTASKHGKKIANLAKGLGAEIGTISDPRFGKVNTYPEPMLKDYFAKEGWTNLP